MSSFDVKEYQRRYQRDNRERILQQRCEYRARNKEKIAVSNRLQYVANRESRMFIQRVKHNSKKIELLDLHGTTACRCGESRPWCLCFHHRNVEDKEFSLASNLHRTNDALKKELSKCDILCHNCHANLHYEENPNVTQADF